MFFVPTEYHRRNSKTKLPSGNKAPSTLAHLIPGNSYSLPLPSKKRKKKRKGDFKLRDKPSFDTYPEEEDQLSASEAKPKVLFVCLWLFVYLFTCLHSFSHLKFSPTSLMKQYWLVVQFDSDVNSTTVSTLYRLLNGVVMEHYLPLIAHLLAAEKKAVC